MRNIAQKVMAQPDRPSFLEVSEVADIARVFEPHLNVIHWRRKPEPPLLKWLDIVAQKESFELKLPISTTPFDLTPLKKQLPRGTGLLAWLLDLQELMGVYHDLTGAERLGVRLNTLGDNMCPRFHVDRVGIRMLCTYSGPGTEWLDNSDVDRSQLGPHGEVCKPNGTVHQAGCFDVLVLKGETFPRNAGAGAVHRSPDVESHQAKRLLLSIEGIE